MSEINEFYSLEEVIKNVLVRVKINSFYYEKCKNKTVLFQSASYTAKYKLTVLIPLMTLSILRGSSATFFCGN